MRRVGKSLITNVVKRLCIKANLELRKDIESALRSARRKEKKKKARHVLDIIIDNALIAKRKALPICQDTGMVVVYLEVGQDIKIRGDLNKAIEKGILEAYKEGAFRKSIVKDPFLRKNTNTNLPSITHTKLVPGKKIRIRIAVKGFGCENMSATKMFRPTDSPSKIEDFVVAIVKQSGSRACPPLYIGIGIGGTLDKAVSLSKEAVLRPVDASSKSPHIARLERNILKKINRLKIGPMGVGGDTTALGVSVLTYPTHIAGLPLAVNISCHATRDAGTSI